MDILPDERSRHASDAYLAWGAALGRGHRLPGPRRTVLSLRPVDARHVRSGLLRTELLRVCVRPELLRAAPVRAVQRHVPPAATSPDQPAGRAVPIMPADPAVLCPVCPPLLCSARLPAAQCHG